MRLIDADALRRQISETYEYEFPTASGGFDEFATKIIPNIINNAITVDAVPVVRGEWIPIPEHENKRCSVCNIVFSDFTLGYYCPNCGAKMEDKPCG